MDKIKYKITDKFTTEVIKEILEVEQKGLTAVNLLEKARSEKSSLHNFFEWDNSIAGEKWRVRQAIGLINEVKIFVEDKELYAFENVQVRIGTTQEDTSREYKPLMEVFSNEEYRNQIITTALDNITFWRDRYKEYSELKLIFDSIDKVKIKWLKKKQ